MNNNYWKILSLFNDESFDFSDIIFDDDVNDCLIKLYFSMLCKDEQEKEELYNDFEKMYNELNEEQKEVAKGEIAKILNIEYKPKVKKKER